uniref:Neur_chan_LBD domain-containing protein n=1 Tax=Rhabditophanes sp. KR3021 TaxID=114890 RepID=A0AC35TZG4_9BILA
MELSNKQNFGSIRNVDSDSGRAGLDARTRLGELIKSKGIAKEFKPRRNSSKPVIISYSMELYQIIDINEPQQYVIISCWNVERWFDENLIWNPVEFDNISKIDLDYNLAWTPDTTLYNTLIMKEDDQRRIRKIKLSTDWKSSRTYVELLYPAIFKFSCKLHFQFFPFDWQICRMTFGSWSSDNRDIDYVPHMNSLGISNYINNEAWSLTYAPCVRKSVKYDCCPNNYTLIEYTLHLRRRPLSYFVHLVVPTFIITLIAITGFFTTSSTSGERSEKITLCISTLLSMSILIMMVSDQMPSTSLLPLISWYYLMAIIMIAAGALSSLFIMSVHTFGKQAERLSPGFVKVAKFFSFISLCGVPAHLMPKKSNPLDEEYKRIMGMSSLNASYSDALTDSRSSFEHYGRNRKKSSVFFQFAKHLFTAGNDNDIVNDVLDEASDENDSYENVVNIEWNPMSTINRNNSNNNDNQCPTYNSTNEHPNPYWKETNISGFNVISTLVNKQNTHPIKRPTKYESISYTKI